MCACIQSPRQLYPRLTSQYRDYVEWCMGQGLELHSKAILSFEDYAARLIQSWWKHLATLRHTHNSAESAELAAREELTDERAATIIQRAWRKHNVQKWLLKIQNYCISVSWLIIIQLQDIKVFRFYRDLIHFHDRGSPSLMLRCINPAEVK